MKISHEHKFSGKIKPSDFAYSTKFSKVTSEKKPEVSAQ